MTMKRTAFFLAAALLAAPAAKAEITVISDETTTAPANRPEFEGLITKVDVPKGYVGIVDQSNGKYRRITLKKGMISNYKVGDYVHIKLRQNMNEAKEIRRVERPARS